MRFRAVLLYCLSCVAALVAAAKQPTLPVVDCIAQISIDSGAIETSFSFKCQLAAFGGYLTEERESMRVVLAPGDEMLGCSPLTSVSDAKFEGSAVILRRGECSFQGKLSHVEAAGAALMLLVNTEETLLPLSTLEYQHIPAAALSVMKSDGDKLIEMMKRSTEVHLQVKTMSLVQQVRARLEFLVDINVPVVFYEEYEGIRGLLEPELGNSDGLLSRISSNGVVIPQEELKSKEWVEFFSWSAKQLSRWRFASDSALHASIAAAVLQIQLWIGSDTDSKRNDLVLAAARKLVERGYYPQSISLLQTLPSSGKAAECLLPFLQFLEGDLITSLHLPEGCKSVEFYVDFPSLRVAQRAFDRLKLYKRSSLDETCLKIAAGTINDTKVASTCCYLANDALTSNQDAVLQSRTFSSEFTKELFHSLVMMGVFLDELGSFGESLRFFGYAGRLCPSDKPTLELRQLLAVPIVFSSQMEMNSFLQRLKRDLNQALLEKKSVEERVVSHLGDSTLSATEPELRPENAAYLQYTITPPTMFTGYQGVNVLPIQQAVNKLRFSLYPSLSSHFDPGEPQRNVKLRRIGFISTWFRAHSVGKLLLGIVQKLDRSKFHVSIFHCVHFLRDSDEVTEAFKRTADGFVELPKEQDLAVKSLRLAELDVAIYPELGMDEWTVLLSHHRVAPVQCVFWGHPITTGNPNIDYFISSQHFVSEDFDDPVDNQDLIQLSGYRRAAFSEQIVLFRGLSTVFKEPKPLTEDVKRFTRSMFYLPTNGRLYTCPQTLMKLHPTFDEALAGILEKDDKATIVLLASDTQLVWMEQLRRRFRKRFGQNSRRVLFLPTLPFDEFQALLTLSDVVLDPFPFGGGVTTLDALQLGIPVVTFPAAQSVVHLAAGFLRYMNVTECIVTSLDKYVQLAVNTAKDHGDIRQQLLEHRNDISQDESTIKDWNEFLETVTPRAT
ncbi:UDP-glucose:protein N-beta-glucosyltransferase [Phytophthora citrophthora]|uniref:UDP-glucose:protein N-beta-glucosyltransferase n=1 Tax=Phytophthora citrophthora TaxID=4793 RepID=A0AAD9GU31_9STRA|nr:UDP-glucose:protein N-beta-glucosyltransferase [Phytophthora citrophthora]